MHDDTQDRGRYLREIQEQADRHTRRLTGDNEALRILVASLETDKSRLESQASLLRQELAVVEIRERRLRAQLQEIENDHDRFAREQALIGKQRADLTHLYAACHRLHESLCRDEVLGAVEEILATIVGSEEIAIYELDSQRGALHLVHSVGIDAERYREVPIGQGPVGRSAADGRIFVAEDDDADPEDGLTASIPLRLGARITGAIAIWGLLGQKQCLGPLDREVFELLSRQASVALYCAQVYERLAGALPTPA